MRPLTLRLQLVGGGVVLQCTQNQLTLISSNLIEDDAWNQSVIENQQFHSKPCLVLVKQYYFGVGGCHPIHTKLTYRKPTKLFKALSCPGER